MLPSALDDLIDLSCALGADPSLVQGGGGNLSKKIDGTLWVKASGFWLSEARDRDIYVPVDLAAIRARMSTALADAGTSEIHVTALGESGLRPSIETTLHAALPHPVVAHVHSVAAICWSVLAGGRDALEERLNGLKWSWVPYARPGVPLTQALAGNAGPDADILVLASHGIVVGAPDCTTAQELIEEIERRLARPARLPQAADLARLAAIARGTGYRAADGVALHSLATDPVSLGHVRRGPLYPDHVVFLGIDAPIVPAGAAPEIREIAAACRGNPPYVLVEGAGLLVKDDISPGAVAMLSCWADVLARLPADAELRTLDEEACFALLGWEAEDYRRTLRRASGG